MKDVIAEIFEKEIRRKVKIRNVSVFNTVEMFLVTNGCFKMKGAMV